MIEIDNALHARIDAVLEEVADERRLSFYEQGWHDLNKIKAMCDSPLEVLLAAHIYGMYDGYFPVKWVASANNPHLSGDGTFWAVQQKIGKYQVDFLFCCRMYGERRFVIVECDGHDFHERTKGQARHDKQRDRFFVGQGASVLRFTGSEIYNSPELCVEEISRVLARMLEEIMGWPSAVQFNRHFVNSNG